MTKHECDRPLTMLVNHGLQWPALSTRCSIASGVLHLEVDK